MAFFAEKILADVGIGVAIGTVTGMTSTIMNIYGFMNNISSYSGPDKNKIINTIDRLNIVTNVKILKKVLDEVIEKKITSEAVAESILELNNIIMKIEAELKIIVMRLKHNESLMVMSYWRAYDCRENISKLETNMIKLNDTKKLFFELQKIKSHLKTEINEAVDKLIKIDLSKNIIVEDYYRTPK